MEEEKKDEKQEDESKQQDKPEEKENEAKKDRLITEDMTIGNIVSDYPSAAAVMMEYGLHCIGCHVAEWETLEQGCKAHGISKEEMDKMLDDLNSPDVIEGRVVFDEEEAIEETREEKSESSKKGFFRRLNI
ncbi:MAG: DUF1858 domain-containing protein [Nanoarchaeota archaeon]|nr:DUF1858 domain-containing protein [Nanoarchaeota archaeon]